jgi:SAM-dependent methyltransferase
VVWDLNDHPLPFADGEFDELHAYEVLEHLGHQGDWRFFCDEWNEYHRILKPGGVFFASVPAPNSPWVWGDPSHTRHIPPQTLTFLSQKEYADQVGMTAMSDFRRWYKGDFSVKHREVNGDTFYFALQRL